MSTFELSFIGALAAVVFLWLLKRLALSIAMVAAVRLASIPRVRAKMVSKEKANLMAMGLSQERAEMLAEKTIDAMIAVIK